MYSENSAASHWKATISPWVQSTQAGDGRRQFIMLCGGNTWHSRHRYNFMTGCGWRNETSTHNCANQPSLTRSKQRHFLARGSFKGVQWYQEPDKTPRQGPCANQEHTGAGVLRDKMDILPYTAIDQFWGINCQNSPDSSCTMCMFLGQNPAPGITIKAEPCS